MLQAILETDGDPGPRASGGQVLASQHSSPGGSEFPMGEVCNPEWGSRGHSGVHCLSSCMVLPRTPEWGRHGGSRAP